MSKKICTRLRLIEQDEQIEFRWMSKGFNLGTIFHADPEISDLSLLGCTFLEYRIHYEKVPLIGTYENSIYLTI